MDEIVNNIDSKIKKEWHKPLLLVLDFKKTLNGTTAGNVEDDWEFNPDTGS